MTSEDARLAAQADDADQLRRLLGGRVDVNATFQPFNWTYLHEASGYNSVSCARALVEARCSVNAAAGDGETPLHLAGQEGKTEMIHFLVEQRADLGAVNEDGDTPLHVAVQHIGSKNFGHISALIECRANPNACNREGQTPRAHAVLHTNRAKEFEAVLGPGSGEAVTERSGLTLQEALPALRAACKRGNVDHVKKLVESVPALDHPTHTTIMTSAAAGGSIDVVEFLVAARADLTAMDEPTGTIPLVAAADEGHTKLVRWMLAQRVDAAATSRDGATALMAAAIRGSSETAELLLAARANVNHQAHAGWTALMVASQSGHQGVARSLVDSRAQLDLKNADGATARSLAQGNGNHDLVRAIDMWTKLNARRSKATGTGNTSEKADDMRDLDSLLTEIGETATVTKSKAKKRASKNSGASKASAAASSPPVESSNPTDAGYPSTVPALNIVEESSTQQSLTEEDVAPEVIAAAGSTEPVAEPCDELPDDTAAQCSQASPECDKESESRGEAVLRLQQELSELERAHAELNAREAKVRAQLAELLGYSPKYAS